MSATVDYKGFLASQGRTGDLYNSFREMTARSTSQSSTSTLTRGDSLSLLEKWARDPETHAGYMNKRLLELAILDDYFNHLM